MKKRERKKNKEKKKRKEGTKSNKQRFVLLVF